MKANYEELIAVPEIGNRIALSIISFFSKPDNINLIDRLEQYNVQLSEEILELERESISLEGKSFVISGVFQNFDRDGLRDKIILNGGKVVSSISSKLDYLIAGDNNAAVIVNQLAAGTYTLKLVCDNGCETTVKKFVKR
jgi:DNA ligase (NAD+)